MKWAEHTRQRLSELLDEAIVVQPLGATEQHGPHLPTGTDALTVTTVAERAVAEAAEECARPLVLAPTMPFGCSDHHLPFGGTLSLSPETLLAVVNDLARSLVAAGGHRLLLINGHGGNRGVSLAAAAAAATRHGLAVAHADYWELADPRPGGLPVPGHAGGFETGLVRAIQPDTVVPPPYRSGAPRPADVPGVVIESNARWKAIDGYTDDPGAVSAADGAKWLEVCVAGLTARLVELGRVL